MNHALSSIWRAMLEQAMDDYAYGPDTLERRSLLRFVRDEYPDVVKNNAEAWIFSESREERSFLWVCEQLGLDPAAVRRQVVENRVSGKSRRKK